VETIIEWRDIYGVTTLVLAASLLVGGLFGWLAERSDYCARSAYEEIFSLTSRKGRGAVQPALASCHCWHIRRLLPF
jgi:hypothetical protein